MTQTLQLDKWDDQELSRLFAARLPLLALPSDYADQLTQTVLDEVARHSGKEQNSPTTSPSNNTQRIRHRYPPYT